MNQWIKIAKFNHKHQRKKLISFKKLSNKWIKIIAIEEEGSCCSHAYGLKAGSWWNSQTFLEAAGEGTSVEGTFAGGTSEVGTFEEEGKIAAVVGMSSDAAAWTDCCSECCSALSCSCNCTQCPSVHAKVLMCMEFRLPCSSTCWAPRIQWF